MNMLLEIFIMSNIRHNDVTINKTRAEAKETSTRSVEN